MTTSRPGPDGTAGSRPTETEGPSTRTPRHTALLLDVWRQVSEHLDIRACCDELWARLRRDLPLRRLWVRRIDRLGFVETVAASPWDPSLTDVRARRTMDASELAALVPWIHQATLEVPPRRIRHLAAPPYVSGDGVVLIGGLVHSGEAVGVLVLDGDPSILGDVGLLRELLAPIVVALRNDQRVLQLARLQEAVAAENRALLSRLARDGVGGTVVGADGGMREVMSRVQQVGQTDAPVLILGETGTGKELIAREIHARSRRSAGPFLKVNCGAIPSELVDSELFGHERGSFTGAIAERRGWFERADGGTLFLDEIGELPAAAQVRLLRVLQDGTYERVGGQRPLHADVRIVAATHRDLREMVRDGRFREDLWYRVGVFPLRLPPLRERMGDLLELAAHFATRAGERLHGRPLVPSPEDLRLFSGYAWPGNVRELGAVIERAAILGDGHHLDVRAALGVQADAAPAPSGARAPQRPEGVAGSSLDDVTRGAIEAALVACGGRVEGRGGAAERLGLKASTLRSRMIKLGISWSAYRTDTGSG